MPAAPPLLALRGSEEYRRALERTLRAARKGGLAVDSISGLAEVALAEFAHRHGIILPRRAQPPGTNRFGEPLRD